MIHCRPIKNPGSQELVELHLSITAESLQPFITLVNRALNCWDRAPQELKELGDLLTHGRVTQDHSN